MHGLKMVAETVNRVIEASINTNDRVRIFLNGSFFYQPGNGNGSKKLKCFLNPGQRKSGLKTHFGNFIDEPVDPPVVFVNDEMIIGVKGFGDRAHQLFFGPAGVLFPGFIFKAVNPYFNNSGPLLLEIVGQMKGHCDNSGIFLQVIVL
jgi:hypothetical protein